MWLAPNDMCCYHKRHSRFQRLNIKEKKKKGSGSLSILSDCAMFRTPSQRSCSDRAFFTPPEVTWGRCWQIVGDPDSSTLILCCAKSLQSCLLLCDPMSPPASSVHGFSRQEHWSGLPCPPPGDLSDPGIEPSSLTVSCTGRQILYH